MTSTGFENRVPARRNGAWRVLAAAPVMLGGLAVLMLFAGGLGRWAAAVPAAWLVLAVAWLTPAGERVAVRLAYGYRRPGAATRAALQPALAVALTRSGAAAGEFDLYARRATGTINAYAAGRRSIAVSAGLVAALDRGELTPAQGGALLTHEIGHLRAHATHYGLAIGWLSAPWRIVVALLGGLLRLILGKVPTARAGLVVLGPIVLGVAAVQGVHQHAWLPLAALAAVGLVLSVQPLVDAALTRAGERVADAYVLACGVGPDLADALNSFQTLPEGGRLRATHPTRAERIHALTGSTA